MQKSRVKIVNVCCTCILQLDMYRNNPTKNNTTNIYCSVCHQIVSLCYGIHLLTWIIFNNFVTIAIANFSLFAA